MAEFSNSQHFENKDPAVKSIYDLILKESRKFGTVMEEPKKTSIHLVNKSVSCAGRGMDIAQGSG